MSLKSEKFWDLVEKTQDKISDHPNERIRNSKMIGHGHIGDGNLHLNCCIEGFDDKSVLKEIEKII